MIRHCFLTLVAATALCAADNPPVATATDWQIAGPFGGTVTTITVDPKSPKTILAGAMDSLLFQSQDYGASWTPLNLPKRNLGEVTSILVDPVDSNHYLVGVLDAFGGGLYDSKDGGKTWMLSPDIRDFGVRALVASASNPSEFVAGTLRGVMLSSDSGASWKRISDPGNFEMEGITAVAIDPNDPNIIYAGTPHLPWKTTDGGKTWSSVHTGMIDDSDVFSIYIDPRDSSQVFASACSGIYASGNRADSWRKLAGIPKTSRRTHVIREDPAHSGTIFAGTTMGLFKSLNAGATWKTLTDTQVNALAFDPLKPETVYLAMQYEGVGKSQSGGEAIQLINNGLVDRQVSALTVSGKKLVAIETQEGETTGIFISPDEGGSWTEVKNTRGLGGVHLRNIAGSKSEDRILIASGPRSLYKSINGGLTWTSLPMRELVNVPAPAVKAAPVRARRVSTTRSAVRRTTRPLKPKPVLRTVLPSEIYGLYATTENGKDAIFAATDLGLFKTTDFGEQWTLQEIGTPLAVTALYISPTVDGRMIIRTPGSLFQSSDFGQHWEKLSFPLAAAEVKDIAMPGDPKGTLLVATHLGLYSSTDGGAKWYANLGGIPASTVNSVVYRGDSNEAYAVEYGHLYQTADGGNHWSPVRSELHSPEIRQLWYANSNSNRLYAITSGLGILFRN